MNKTVVFDFDGVIHSYRSGWQGTSVANDPPVEGIREAIMELHTAGFTIVICSTRCMTSEGRLAVEDYCASNSIYYDRVTAYKPPAVAYVDDRAICFRGDCKGLVEQVKDFKTRMEERQ